MELKNVVIGSKIEAKHDTKFFSEGEIVKVLYKEGSDYEGDCSLKLENNKGEKLWSNHKDFRRPRVVAPKLKTLDQSAFDHQYVTEKFKYVALNSDGQAAFFENKPVIHNCLDIWIVHTGSTMPMLTGYDASDWQNSLMKRESKELTGSELCMSLLNDDQDVMCLTDCTGYELIVAHDGCCFISDEGIPFEHVTPINRHGKILTASQVGL